jgi:adenosine deaminase
MDGVADEVKALARAIPKAELHVHLEGCLDAELLFSLAERNDVELPWPSIDELRAAYRFADLPSFLTLYFEGCRVLVTESDFYDLTRHYLSRAHADGIVRVEAFLGPQTFLDRGTPIGDVLGGVLRAMADAEADDGISAGLLVSAHRHRSEAAAFELLDAVLPWIGQSDQVDRIVGFGLGGAEAGNPPRRFARYFAELRRLGFRTTAHAGEEGPASYVREAVQLLGVDRIDHGVRALEDPDLVADLAGAQIPLTVCPLSNVALNVVDDLREHPLPAMLAAGLNVTINSDDPAYLGGYLLENYLRCIDVFDLDAAAVAALAANSIRASFLSDAEKDRLVASILVVYATVAPS